MRPPRPSAKLSGPGTTGLLVPLLLFLLPLAGGARGEEPPDPRPSAPLGAADEFPRTRLEQALIRAEASATRFAAIQSAHAGPGGR